MTRVSTLAVAGALVACGYAGHSPVDVLGPDASDDAGGTDAMFTPVADAGIDAPADAGPGLPAGCRSLVIDHFSPPDPRWIAAGSASFGGGETTLTPAVPHQAGAIWIAVDPPAKSFHAEFKLHVTGTQQPAFQGIAIGWSASLDAGVPQVGVDSSGVGFCGGPNLGGAFKMLTGSMHMQLSADVTSGNTCSEIDMQPFTVEMTNDATVDYKAGMFLAEVRNSNGKIDFVSRKIGGSSSFGWLGFTGGTGEEAALHVVDDVDIYVCP